MEKDKRKILIFATHKGGHRSSSTAIKDALYELDPDIDVNAFDSMELMPGYKSGSEQGYVTFTKHFKLLWKFFFEFSSLFKGLCDFFVYKSAIKRFKKLMEEYKPDIILSVHPAFVGCAIKCLKKSKLNIPLYICVIDLVKHSRLWRDKRCDMTFVPTLKMYNLFLKKGFKKERLVHSGFPVQDKFNSINKNQKTKIIVPNVLMANPSLKRDKVALKLILTTLKHNVNLTVVTGSDEKLKKYLDKKLISTKNVTVLGYISDMAERLADADVLISKAGPNIILEAVKMCVPVLITGHILGQEEKNYQYIVENKYGLRCDNPKELDSALSRLFENDYKLLKEFSHNQKECNDVDGAKVVAKHLLEALNKSDCEKTLPI